MTNSYYIWSPINGQTAMRIRGKRAYYDVYADILNYLSVVGKSRVTSIARHANLPVDRANEALSRMTSLGFVREEFLGRYRFFRITARGYEYLETYRRLKHLLGEDYTL